MVNVNAKRVIHFADRLDPHGAATLRQSWPNKDKMTSRQSCIYFRGNLHSTLTFITHSITDETYSKVIELLACHDRKVTAAVLSISLLFKGNGFHDCSLMEKFCLSITCLTSGRSIRSLSIQKQLYFIVLMEIHRLSLRAHFKFELGICNNGRSDLRQKQTGPL